MGDALVSIPATRDCLAEEKALAMRAEADRRMKELANIAREQDRSMAGLLLFQMLDGGRYWPKCRPTAATEHLPRRFQDCSKYVPAGPRCNVARTRENERRRQRIAAGLAP